MENTNNTNNTRFSYDYSSDNVKQAEEIVSKYIPQEKSALEKMKEIDAQVNKKATILSISIGVIGALVLGTGMAIVMEATGIAFITGIVIGLIGLGICGSAFFFYQDKLKKERAKVADEIVILRREI